MGFIEVITSAVFLEKVLPPLITALVGWAVKAWLARGAERTSKSTVIAIEQWPKVVEDAFKDQALELLKKNYDLNSEDGKAAIDTAISELIDKTKKAVKSSVKETATELDVSKDVSEYVKTILRAYKETIEERKNGGSSESGDQK